MATASVIIPTHGRPEKLERCLDALAQQRLATGDSIEVIVAVDGALRDGARASTSGSDFETRIELPRVGVSAARNAAIDLAQGEYLLFINDDCYPDDDWARTHIAAQRRGDTPSMIVGRTDWMAWSDPTVFDGLLRDTSMIFFYDTMRDGEHYGFRHFWTCNASVPTSVARELSGFDDRIRPYLFDDVEFAWRVEQRFGGGVYYVASARNTHDHRVSWGDYLERERCLGQMAVRLADANIACFAEIFGYDDPGRMRDDLVKWLDMHADELAGLDSTIASQMSQPLPSGDAWTDLRDRLYTGHLPVKRRLFRQGFVDAFGSAVLDRPTMHRQLSRGSI